MSDTLPPTDTAIQGRIKRGRAEVEVTAMSGEPWFGAWRALSISSSTHFPQHYQVTIRSLHRRANLCSCPDFAGNQLGTCKHVEAVLHKIKKHPAYDTFKDQPAPFSYVSLAWDVEGAPKLRLHRAPGLSTELQTIADNYFDPQGTFLGRLPDDFFRFTDLVEERGDIHIGPDAFDYTRRLAAERAELAAPLSPQEAGVWIHSEAAPKGLMRQEEVALLMRTLALAQASSLPGALLMPLLAEVEMMHGLQRITPTGTAP